MRLATIRSLKIFAVLLLLTGLPAYAQQQTASKKFVFTTKSKEARESAEQAIKMIESFQPAPQILPLAQKAVTADPDFAFAHYLVATFTPPPQPGATPPQAANTPKAHMDKALELSKRASDGERRYLEALALVRAQKPGDALPLLRQLVQDYPEERMARMMLGQVLFNRGEMEEARTNFERAVALDNSTPRVYNFLGNYHLLKGDYAKAREMYGQALKRTVKGTAPFGPNYGLAFTHIYEGNIPEALKVLNRFQEEYSRTPGAAEFPPVFIWNSIARLHLENGQPEQALKFYEMGYQTVPGSKLPAEEKMIWQGRLHHGRGRALAKLGKHEEAWKEAEQIKKMIDENPERGKQFMPSYHYIAGYLKLEGGDHAKALEHLKQADQSDLFHKLLLARAYDRSGDAANAQKLYREIVESKQNSLERALAVPEAKKKLKG
ncbi:MAG TPA: tetratricopeptide repeat protein [Pyrinomonadaceae bacterium]|nr:tetratricopeptide repeat protein [Pyrinomonadaceae bacterium]